MSIQPSLVIIGDDKTEIKYNLNARGNNKKKSSHLFLENFIEMQE
jgi:hypothetical protein